MKKILTKLLVSVLIVLILSNYCMTNVAYANAMEIFTEVADAAWGLIVEFIEDILGTVVGIFAIIPKVIVLPLCLSAQSFMASIAYSQGKADAEGNISNAVILDATTWFLTPFDILFNKVALVDVNIFNIPTTPGAIKSIREAAAGWYYIMRMIAASILLCVLIYVGIRMALSTVASDKAAYKKMLVDWVVSLALIFLMQYIIVFTFEVNTAFIKSLASVSKSEGVSTAILKLYAAALWVDIDSIAATIVICMLTWQTISLLISYISRMLKVTFLVIISPLITLTYSIDKMGDGKAQALNAWLKEFIYTVLLQPFHCIIYTAFIGIAMSILAGETLLGIPFILQYDNNNVGAAILCVLCIHFTKEAEKILGKIFNFADSTSGTSLATGMMATAAIASNAKNIGKGARTLVNGAKNVRSFANNAAVTIGTAMAVGRGEDAEKARARVAEKVQSFNDNIDSSVKNVKDTVSGTAKGLLIGTMAKAATARSMRKEDQAKVEAKAKDIMKNTGMSKKEAMSEARAEVARENRRNKKERKAEKKEQQEEQKRNISGAISYWKNSDTAKQLKQDVIPSIISTGAGIFVGAGSFGVGGNAVQSIMLGTATSKGTGEFFKTSTNRLAEENAKLIQGAGKGTREEAIEYLGEIAGREDEFKEASKQLDAIYAEILEACGNLNEKGKNQVRGTLKNIIDKTLMENPTATNADIMNAIQGNKTLQDLRVTDKIASGEEKIVKSVGDAIDFQRDLKVYENMSNVASWGLKPEAMVDDTMRRFQETPQAPSESPSGNGSEERPREDESTPPTTPPPKSNNEGEEDVVEEDVVVEEEEVEGEVDPADMREAERVAEEAAFEEFRRMPDTERNKLIRELETQQELTQQQIAMMEKLLRKTQLDNTRLYEDKESLENVIRKLRNATGNGGNK